MAQVVGINELRVGMYVHLDLSWMSHPFPRSSFKLESVRQIEKIRQLGLKSLRWDPARSDLTSPQEAHDEESSPGVTGAGPASEPVAEPQKSPSPQERAAAHRRQTLSLQRDRARLCESQYLEASQAWRAAFDRVAQQPQLARQETEALSCALRDKMLVEGEMCIRVLNAASGDRATAHAMNVAVISMLMGRMFGLADDELAALGTGALLHDVGKLDVPERLRHSDEHFSPAERRVYAEHVELGLAHARRMRLGETATQVIAGHHECTDGSGFPRGAMGEGISLAARIVALVNRFDNLCNPPSLARALTPHDALSTLFSHCRSQFDVTVLNSFIRMMGVYPAGSVVQLTDDRYALVISVNSVRPLKPCVLVFDPAVPPDEALHLDLETTRDLGIRRSLKASQLPPEALSYLAPRPRVAYFFEPGSGAQVDASPATSQWAQLNRS